MADPDPPSDSEQSFHSTHSRSPSPPRPTTDRYPPEEESRLLAESATLKASGNALFARGSYSEAISIYDRSLASLPGYLDYEPAVLHANMAACHLKLSEWDEAVASATKAVDTLERLEFVPKVKQVKGEKADLEGLGKERMEADAKADAEAEAADARAKLDAQERLEGSGHTLTEVRKLRTKALLRRGQARTHLDSWAALQGADEDYRAVLEIEGAGETERRTAQGALAALGPRLDDARQREMAEMMGKLKGLGNSILKPFGLSTNYFNFVKDEKGGYSMQFNQNGK